MSESSGFVTTVKIYNKTYGIRGNDPDHIRHLADLVDQKMCEVAEYTPTVDSAKVAILAALNIADEYVSVQRQLELLEDEVIDRGEQLNAMLEPCCRSAS
jgi:cell division protein ZapA